MLGLLDPALGDFINCTPNYPDETDPNSYGGAKAYLKEANKLPGAPVKNACLLGANSECIADSNNYAETDAVPNRWHFTNVSDGAENPKP